MEGNFKAKIKREGNQKLENEPLKTVEDKETAESIYKKEVLPLIKIFSPDGEDFELYEKRIVSNLQENLERKYDREGRLIVDPKEIMREMKQILHQRAKAVLEDYHSAVEKGRSIKPDAELVKKAKIVLLYEKDYSDWKKEYKYSSSPLAEENRDSIKYYLDIGRYSTGQKLDRNEVVGLMDAGLSSFILNLQNYEYSEHIKETPDRLLQLLIIEKNKNKNKNSNIDLKSVLEYSADPQGYSKETFYALLKSEQSYLAFKNLKLFEKSIEVDDIKYAVENYAVEYPYHLESILDSVQKINLPQEKKEEIINVVFKHQYITKNGKEIEQIKDDSIELKYKNLYQEFLRLFRVPNNETMIRGLTQENLPEVKKVVEDGYLTFFYDQNDSVRYFRDHDYEWFVSQIVKNDQENLLLGKSEEFLKPEDQKKYAEKLINKKKINILYTLVNKGNFSVDSLDENIYQTLVKGDYVVDPRFFKNLSEESFKKTLSKETSYLKYSGLYNNIDKFVFKPESEFADYKKYQDFVVSLEKEFGLKNDGLFNDLSFNFENVKEKGFEKYKEEIIGKLNILKSKLPNLYPNYDTENSRIAGFQNEFGFKVLNEPKEYLDKIFDSLRYLPQRLRFGDKDLFIDFLRQIKDFSEEKKIKVGEELEELFKVFDVSMHKIIFHIYLSKIGDLESIEKIKKDDIFQIARKMPEYMEMYKNLDEEKKKFFQDIFPWSESLLDLEKIQKRSKRKEYDLWETDFVPLIHYSKDFIDLSNIEDGKNTTEFIERFGMKKNVQLFELFLKIKRSISVDKIDPEIDQILQGTFNINAQELCKNDKSNLNLIFTEMEKFQKELLSKILAGDRELVKKISESKYLSEIFTTLVGWSTHSHGGTQEQVLKKYLEVSDKNLEKYRLPEGYLDIELEIPENVYEESKTNDLIKKEKEKIFNNIELNNILDEYSKVLFDLENKKDNFLNYFAGKLGKVKEFFSGSILSLEKKIAEEKNKENFNEKMIFGLGKKLEKYQKMYLEFNREAEKVFQINPEISLVMDFFYQNVPDEFSDKKEILMNLSLRDMAIKMPVGYEDLINSLKEADVGRKINKFYDFMAVNVKDHYLNKKHGQEESIQNENKELIKYLKKSWGVQDFEKSILAVSNNKLNELDKGQISIKTRKLDLVPSKGLMRIFSGDMGGACTSRQNLKLAEGEFEDLVSYSLVLDKGKKETERFVGSFVVIETKTETGEKAIVLRANNPAENLINMVHEESLIGSIVEEFRALAERRGIKNVLVAVGGGSSSNRSKVQLYYRNNFGKNEKVGLENTETTNFNNYPIWNKDGNEAVVRI